MKRVALLFVAALVPVLSHGVEPGSLGLVYQIDPVERIWFNQGGPSEINTEKVNGVGALWRLSEKLAIKPMLLFDLVNYSTEVDDEEVTEWSATILGGEVELLFTLKTMDRLLVFLAPAVRLAWVSTRQDYKATDEEEEAKIIEAGAVVSLGARFAISDRLAVFGQWGIGLAYSSVDFEETGEETEQVRGLALHTDQAGIGLIFFVK